MNPKNAEEIAVQREEALKRVGEMRTQDLAPFQKVTYRYARAKTINTS